jgi:hypothetical protein
MAAAADAAYTALDNICTYMNAADNSSGITYTLPGVDYKLTYLSMLQSMLIDENSGWTDMRNLYDLYQNDLDQNEEFEQFSLDSYQTERNSFNNVCSLLNGDNESWIGDVYSNYQLNNPMYGDLYTAFFSTTANDVAKVTALNNLFVTVGASAEYKNQHFMDLPGIGSYTVNTANLDLYMSAVDAMMKDAALNDEGNGYRYGSHAFYQMVTTAQALDFGTIGWACEEMLRTIISVDQLQTMNSLAQALYDEDATAAYIQLEAIYTYFQDIVQTEENVILDTEYAADMYELDIRSYMLREDNEDYNPLNRFYHEYYNVPVDLNSDNQGAINEVIYNIQGNFLKQSTADYLTARYNTAVSAAAYVDNLLDVVGDVTLLGGKLDDETLSSSVNLSDFELTGLIVNQKYVPLIQQDIQARMNDDDYIYEDGTNWLKYYIQYKSDPTASDTREVMAAYMALNDILHYIDNSQTWNESYLNTWSGYVDAIAVAVNTGNADDVYNTLVALYTAKRSELESDPKEKAKWESYNGPDAAGTCQIDKQFCMVRIQELMKEASKSKLSDYLSLGDAAYAGHLIWAMEDIRNAVNDSQLSEMSFAAPLYQVLNKTAATDGAPAIAVTGSAITINSADLSAFVSNVLANGTMLGNDDNWSYLYYNEDSFAAYVDGIAGFINDSSFVNDGTNPEYQRGLYLYARDIQLYGMYTDTGSVYRAAAEIINTIIQVNKVLQ